MLLITFFKDRECLTPLLKQEDFDNLDSSEINSLLTLFELTVMNFSEKNIQKISVMPFFLNSFMHVKDSVDKFFGRAIACLSSYQNVLLQFGVRNCCVLSNGDKTPPDFTEHTKIEDMVKWYDLEYSILVSKNKKDSKPDGFRTSIKEVHR
jgi:hypothetical protein